jgi:hypothetical protein
MVKTGSLKLKKTVVDRYRRSVVFKRGNFLLDFILVLSNVFGALTGNSNLRN